MVDVIKEIAKYFAETVSGIKSEVIQLESEVY